MIRELNSYGKTFLIVEHNMPFVLGLCDPVHVLGPRRARWPLARPTQIQADPAVIDAYLGDDFVLEGAESSAGQQEVRRARERRHVADVRRRRRLRRRRRPPGRRHHGPKGAVACIVGPNGAGKSTVLKTVSGLLTPRLGEIHLDGRADRTGARPREILGRGVSQVPQSNALFPQHERAGERPARCLHHPPAEGTGAASATSGWPSCSRSSPSAARRMPATCPAVSAGWWSSPGR